MQDLRDLRLEVDCRIEHGAESQGHLEYVRGRLDDILNKVPMQGTHPADDPHSFSAFISDLLTSWGWYRSTGGWRETSDKDRGLRPALSEGQVVDEMIRRDWAKRA